MRPECYGPHSWRLGGPWGMEQCINCGALKGPPKEQESMKRDTAYMNLKDGHSIEEIIGYMNGLAVAAGGGPFLLNDLKDLRKRVLAEPDLHGKFRPVKIIVKLIDG